MRWAIHRRRSHRFSLSLSFSITLSFSFLLSWRSTLQSDCRPSRTDLVNYPKSTPRVSPSARLRVRLSPCPFVHPSNFHGFYLPLKQTICLFFTDSDSMRALVKGAAAPFEGWSQLRFIWWLCWSGSLQWILLQIVPGASFQLKTQFSSYVGRAPCPGHSEGLSGV